MRAAALLPLLTTLLLVTPPARADQPPVYVVVFTHVEDNTPGGMLGSPQSRQSYMTVRSRLIAMAAAAESAGVQWTLQPDWKILEAALLYEDVPTQATTNGKNFLRYLKEDRGVVIDPHSHENGGYNYTDVAHLLDSLGVGATTVIGGHVWDPALPQFSAWDRFRVPVAGEHYPAAQWRGDILIGSGTPNHVNDPLVSGVWRPRDRDHYFEHDPAGNITAVGPYKHSVTFIAELIGLYRSGTVPSHVMLTFSSNIGAGTLAAPNGVAAAIDTVLRPIATWRDSGLVIPTDFTSLIHTWETDYGAFGYLYDAEAPVVAVPAAFTPAGITLRAEGAIPITDDAVLKFSSGSDATVRLAVFDIQGREIAVLANGRYPAGDHAATWHARGAPNGVYLCRLDVSESTGAAVRLTAKLIVAR